MKNIHVLPTDKPSRLHLGNSGLVLCDLIFNPTTINAQHIYITSDEEIKVNDYITDGYLVWKWKDDSSLLGRKKVITTTDQDLINKGVQAIDDEFLEWFVKNPSCEVVEVIKEDVEQPKPLYPNGNHKGERVWIETYKIIIPKEEPNKTHYLDELPNMDREVLAKMWESAMPKLEPKQETLEEAAKKLFGSLEKGIGADRRNIWMNGAKWQAENYGLMEIELRHTKTLLASCEKALEKRDKQQERSYSEEEVIELLQKALTHKDNGETGNLITAQGEIRAANFYSWFEQNKKK